MLQIHKHLVTDEQQRPVAVQVRYEDWLAIERLLEQASEQTSATRIRQLAGTLALEQDPLEFQRQIRGDWP